MKHGIKIAAVIAIGAFFVLYFVLYMLVAFLAPDMPMIARIAVGGFGAFIAGYMINWKCLAWSMEARSRP